jgi:hypothetical protein
MIALAPQTAQRHRSANGLAALGPQSQWVSGWFVMAFSFRVQTWVAAASLPQALVRLRLHSRQMDTPCLQNLPDHRYPLFHTYMFAVDHATKHFDRTVIVGDKQSFARLYFHFSAAALMPSAGITPCITHISSAHARLARRP